ncbi:Lcl C-terminal domain-containing protein [Cellvibrio sp. QJXJ]|uniref:Lcl C-terminal domain-containing protein n=1 Tax=Cellvibrio sp. QJXJ TaxID=2964606 RepID=UPI0021C31610|nr:DUF1566 domain-containing protein [Cellvibrio sp. QJXJ]UUA74778.1 DUF1566 domain-containing protein [Cellvibrio sp. QJXJ]
MALKLRAHGKGFMQTKRLLTILVAVSIAATFFALHFKEFLKENSETKSAHHSNETIHHAGSGVNENIGEKDKFEKKLSDSIQPTSSNKHSSSIALSDLDKESQKHAQDITEVFESERKIKDMSVDDAPSESSEAPLGSELNLDDKDNDLPKRHRFIKIDSFGNRLADDAEVWSCIFDNKTNLLWESKSVSAPGLSHEFRYRWSDDASGSLSIEDNQRIVSNCPYFTEDKTGNLKDCNISMHSIVINSMSLCGTNSWHVPSVLELESIVKSGQHNPAVDIKYFPLTQSDYYWSREGFAYTEYNAWAINFAVGKVNDVEKTEFVYVRLVSGESSITKPPPP